MGVGAPTLHIVENPHIILTSQNLNYRALVPGPSTDFQPWIENTILDPWSFEPSNAKPVICNNMNGPKGNHAKLYKSDSKINTV